MDERNESTEAQIENLLRYPVTMENVIEWWDIMDITLREGYLGDGYRGRHRDDS